MRWGSIVALLITLVLAAIAAQGVNPSTQAQEATPDAEQQAGELEGVSARTLASGSIEVLAPSTAYLSLGRIALAPGASLDFDPTDPAAVLVYTASGELTFLVEEPIPVARSAEAGTPVPAEEVAAN